MKKSLAGVMGMFFLCICASAHAAYYLEDFNQNMGGWEVAGIGSSGVLQSNGGVGDSGYLRGERPTYSPSFQPFSGDAVTYAHGNLEDTYGNWIQMSYYGNIFQGGNQNVLHQFGYDDGVSADLLRYTYWRKVVVDVGDLGDFTNVWGQITFTINTNWTDAEANAAGWYMLDMAGRGTESWATVMENVFNNSPFYGFNSGGTTIAGIDNVSISSVPVPGAIWLLGSGLLGLTGFRTRFKKV